MQLVTEIDTTVGVCRTQKFIGKAKLMTFDLSSQMSRRIVVATEQNVLASLNARDGKIGDRAAFGKLSQSVKVSTDDRMVHF